MISCDDAARFFMSRVDEDAGDLMSNLKLQKMKSYFGKIEVVSNPHQQLIAKEFIEYFSTQDYWGNLTKSYQFYKFQCRMSLRGGVGKEIGY